MEIGDIVENYWFVKGDIEEPRDELTRGHQVAKHHILPSVWQVRNEMGILERMIQWNINAVDRNGSTCPKALLQRGEDAEARFYALPWVSGSRTLLPSDHLFQRSLVELHTEAIVTQPHIGVGGLVGTTHVPSE